MILNNYYRFFEMLYKGDATGRSTKFVEPSGTEKIIRYRAGNTGYHDTVVLYRFGAYSGSLTSSGVVFGNGTIPPTVNDYTLSGERVTGLSAASSLQRIDEGDGKVAIICNWLITNNNENAVTIGEVAYLESIGGYKPDSTSTLSGNFMVDRTVLDTPVTIPAGGVGQVTYTIRMNYPTV